MSVFLEQSLQQTLIQSLQQQSWWVGKNCFDEQLIVQLAQETKQLFEAQKMSAAGIGRGQQFQQNPEIRQDLIHWLEGKSEPQRNYLGFMESIRQLLNQELFLGLFELEAHYAIYPQGAFYKKHRDSFHGAANRIVSVVTYLNPDWPEHGGGELFIYAPNGDEIIQTVRPEAGTLVIFLSEEIPHEVAISHYPRSSIAGWFRLNNPR